MGDNAAGELGTTPAVAFNLWYRAIRDAGAADPGNNWKWVEDWARPRVDNPLACPPFVFSTEFK